MFGSVATAPKSLDLYRPLVGNAVIEELRRLGRDLAGARVLHLNATAYGGGVAELLATLVPLMNDVGVEAEWRVIQGSPEFFAVTKALHNSLQGMRIPWTPQMWQLWLHYNQLNASLLKASLDSYDFVVVHDPQPAGVLWVLSQEPGWRRRGRYVWRCHLDLTSAEPEAWEAFRAYVEPYDAAIVTMERYLPADLGVPRAFVIPPAIDPLSLKNVDLPAETIAEVLHRFGVDPSRPMLLQVSRFDPWKDPLGVVDVYRDLKTKVPGLQLVMAASMAHDDPEGLAYYERTARHAGEDYDIHLLSNLNGVGSLEVNAFQRAAHVVIQKSIREGFGLVVSEALWKGRPVVAGNVGGIPLQVIDGATGFLANTHEEFVDRALRLLRDPRLARRLGANGREHVREHYLITRYLRDYLLAFRRLAEHDDGTASSNLAGASYAG